MFAIGDLERADPDSINAVVGALDDPVASVRLHALAALRRIGRAATAPLLSRIADETRSPHVDTVEVGCGRVEFVPRKADLAAAALTIMGDVDTNLFWAQYPGVTEETKGRLARVALMAEVTPSSKILERLTSIDDPTRRLLLAATRTGGSETAAALATIATKVRAGGVSSRARAIDRDIMVALASMLPTSHEIFRHVAEDTPWPENVVAALIDPRARRTPISPELAGYRLELAAAAFRVAVGRQDPEAFSNLIDSLEAWSFTVGQSVSNGSVLGVAIGEGATLAFIRHPPPTTSAGRGAFLRALRVFADRQVARPDLIETARRFASAPEKEIRRAAYDLFTILAKTSANPDDRDRVWRVVLETLSTVSLNRQDAFPPWHAPLELPAPSPAAEQAAAQALVDLVLAGRLDPSNLGYWTGRRTDSMQSFADAIRGAVRAAEARGVDAPTRYARLLEAVEAAPSERIKALHAAVDARGALVDVLWALGRLAQYPAETPGVVRRLIGMLRGAGDEQAARTIAEALIATYAEGVTAAWAVAVDVSLPAPIRWAAWQAVSSRVRYFGDPRRPQWIEQAIALLSSGHDGTSTRIGLDLLKVLAPQSTDGPAGFQMGGTAPRMAATDDASSTSPELAARLTAVLTPILRGPDPLFASDAALVWVSHRLPPDAAAQVLQQAGHPPVVRPRTPAHDLASLRALSPGSPEWKLLISDRLRSSDRRLFCQTIELLPGSGFDAVGPMAELVLALENSRASKGIWERFAPNVQGVCTLGETLPVTVRRILNSVAQSTRQAVLTLALDRLADERERAGSPGAGALTEARLLSPSVSERATFHLERGEASAASLGAEAIGASLGSAVVSPLLQHLDAGGRPTDFWSAVARAGFAASPSMGSPGGKGPAFAVPNRAALGTDDVAALDRLLAALATRWTRLMPVERAALLPLFGGASPTDEGVSRVIPISLSSASAGERDRALTVADSLKLAPPELAAAKDLSEQENALRIRLSRKLAVAFDAFYPPGPMCMSGRQDRQSLPLFPWPPPTGYRTPEPLSLSLFGGSNATAGTFFDRLRAAFGEISPDFEIGLFSGPPDGFAVVARLERIQPDGVPFPGRVRWTSEGRPKLALSDLLGDLFLERPGYFRVIAFVVTSQAVFEPSARDRLPGVTDGAQVMPADLAARSLAGLHVFALVYSFERPAGGKLRVWVDGSPSARHHLEASGLWSKFVQGRRP
jgi:hypothetical protein